MVGGVGSVQMMYLRAMWGTECSLEKVNWNELSLKEKGRNERALTVQLSISVFLLGYRIK